MVNEQGGIFGQAMAKSIAAGDTPHAVQIFNLAHPGVVEPTTPAVLSENWRLNKSSYPPLELAHAIRALSKLAGNLSMRTKDIRFAGANVSFSTDDIIRIDPTFALKGMPISPDDFDVLAGLTAHEAGHEIVESGKLGIASATNMNTEDNEVTVEDIALVGEEIVVDSYFRREHPLVYQYIKKARDAYKADKSEINWGSTLVAWMNMSVYGHMLYDQAPLPVVDKITKILPLSAKLSATTLRPTERASIYSDILAFFTVDRDVQKWKRKLTQEAKQSADEKDDAVSRAMARAGQGKGGKIPETYDTGGDEDIDEAEDKDSDSESDDGDDAGDEFDSTLNDLLKSFSGDEDKVEGSPKEKGKLDNQQQPPRKPEAVMGSESTAVLPEELIKQIEKILEQEAATGESMEDLTAELQELGAVTNKTQAIIFEPGTDAAIQEPNFDKEFFEKLLWMNRLKNTVGYETYRGEERGKVDSNRLYRAAIDGKVMKQRRRLPLKDLDLVLVLDSSSSMGNHKSVYHAAHALHQAIPESEVLTYYNGSNVVITRTAGKHQPFREVSPTGTTPSGLALLVAARRNPSALIIHFTDGASNVGSMPVDAMKLVHENYPAVKVIDIRYRPGYTRPMRPLGYSSLGGYAAIQEDPDEAAKEAMYSLDNWKIVYISNLNDFPDALMDATKDWYKAW